MVKPLFKLDKITQKNQKYRRSIYKTKNMEIVLMSIPPKQEVPMEKHYREDQFIRIEGGKANIIVGKSKTSPKKSYKLHDDDAIVIPKNTWHNIRNPSTKYPLKLYSIYAPAENHS